MQGKNAILFGIVLLCLSISVVTPVSAALNLVVGEVKETEHLWGGEFNDYWLFFG